MKDGKLINVGCAEGGTGKNAGIIAVTWAIDGEPDYFFSSELSLH